MRPLVRWECCSVALFGYGYVLFVVLPGLSDEARRCLVVETAWWLMLAFVVRWTPISSLWQREKLPTRSLYSKVSIAIAKVIDIPERKHLIAAGMTSRIVLLRSHNLGLLPQNINSN